MNSCRLLSAFKNDILRTKCIFRNSNAISKTNVKCEMNLDEKEGTLQDCLAVYLVVVDLSRLPLDACFL